MIKKITPNGSRRGCQTFVSYAGLAFVLSCALTHAAHAADWSITDLGEVGRVNLGATGMTAWDINNAGDVVGSYTYSSSQYTQTAFVYKNGIIQSLGNLGDMQYTKSASVAYSINNNGQVAGQSWTPSGQLHAFSYENSLMTDLGTLGGPYSSASGINDAGKIVGYSFVPNYPRSTYATVPFLYSNGSMVNINVDGPPYSDSISAVAINNVAQIIGNYQHEGYSARPSRGFLYSDGTLIDIGDLGGIRTVANSINDSGQVVGYSLKYDQVLGSYFEHAFLYQNGTMTDLGALDGAFSRANDVNSLGQIVGMSNIAGSTDAHGFLFSDGIMLDLSTLPDVLASGWVINDAKAINDKGQIVGSGMVNGIEHAYVLSRVYDVPEPPTLLLTALGLLIVSKRNRFSASRLIRK